jgi:uncharacterized protein (TIGR00106 family)
MVLLEFSVVPLGAGDSVAQHVARCVELVEASGLPFEVHSMGTIVEGDLDQVLAIVRDCVALLAIEVDRVTCQVKLDLRRGATGRLRGKVESVERHLGRKLS